MSAVIRSSTPARMRQILTLSAMFAFAAAANAQSAAERALDRAIAHFQGGRVAESVAEFDNVAKLVPDEAPYLWQRGIALYYAGRYRDCREQFESYRAVNPNDVENAAWHFLCVTRAESVEKARAALLPVGPDARVPMREVYQMFQGALSPDKVLAMAGAGVQSKFYAHLYVGLYVDALGRKADALAHIRAAAADRYATAGGYMHIVARVHLTILQRGHSQAALRSNLPNGHFVSCKLRRHTWRPAVRDGPARCTGFGTHANQRGAELV